MQFGYANSIDYRENKLTAIIFECQIDCCKSNEYLFRAITVQFSSIIHELRGCCIAEFITFILIFACFSSVF